MSFTTTIFLIGFLPWIILLSFLLKKWNNSRYIILFVANSIFYIWGGIGGFIFVCVFSIMVWAFALIITKTNSKFVFVISICLTIIPLVLVKYSEFFITSINRLFKWEIITPELFVPIGVSFFTFEAISLLSDIYKGKVLEKINIIKTFLYITFFPTVTSGPIIRYANFSDGLKKSIDTSHYSEAIERIAIGLCKKVLIADKIAPLSEYYFNGLAKGNSFSTVGLWMGSVAYTLQLYFDFSGYSDMAIGIGNLLGFNIPENFNKPYRARSISEFWRRWHITLGQWFRDYIYIPLGGNRCSVPKHIANLLVVWLLTGLWHGANWSFVVWGVGYFALMIIEKYVPILKKIGSSWIGTLYTLFFVNLLWIPFRASNLMVAKDYLLGMVGIGSTGNIEDIVFEFIPYMILAILLCLPFEKLIKRYAAQSWFRLVKGIVVIILTFIAVCSVINSAYRPYIYGTF